MENYLRRGKETGQNVVLDHLPCCGLKDTFTELFDVWEEKALPVVDLDEIVGAHPISAVGKSSRLVIQNFGNISDNYPVIFSYPDGVELSFSSTQFGTNGYFDVSERIFGSTGVADAPYSGPLQITGQKPWTWIDDAAAKGAPGKFAADGVFTDNLRLADGMKDRGFIESITSGHYHNQKADGVSSARSCILGRKAAETGQEVRWDGLLKDSEVHSLGTDITQFK